uniref:Rx N-terminal domain-containing protein n=1 Tax=Leersia perrieri TaxID=77586 RepID=A0A0D9XCJ5_9ORYZ
MVGAEMLVAAAVSQVARKINSIVGIAHGEVKLCCNFSDDLEGIKDTLVYLESLLKNAENNSFGSDRANLRHWLGQIKSLAYDIEDIVDGYYSSKELFEGSSYGQKGSLFCSLSNPMLLKGSMVYKMKSKREMLQQRQQLPNQYHFLSQMNSAINFEEKQTTSYRNTDIAIVGRDADLDHLMDVLMQNDAEELSIVPIVGPVGFGKTSLAQLIFSDTRTEAFSFRIWVHVSMGIINLEKIGRDIVSQTTERIEGNMQLQSVKNAVQRVLNKYSCLIVLDSLWGKDEEVNELKQMLLTGRHTESKVIVTTHSNKVAKLISTIPPYKLSALSEDECLTIFSQRAMTGQGDPLFREYGKEIITRCEGTPLVANFLGSVVNAQRQRREIWQAAKDEEMWKIEEDYPEDKISPLFPSFKTIYYNMPHELRLCFVYCSIFPKGTVIEKKKLIQQWIALDMIESRHGTLPLDVTAEKYIDELKAIYFLQNDAERSGASEEMLRMHNLAHDLARSVAGEDILVILDAENERNARYCDYRYAQVSASSLESIDRKAWPSKARSLIFKNSGADFEHVSEVLSANKYLRVLDLSGCSVKDIPSPIFQLKQLRYLDVSSLSITVLPVQINSFQKLQMLDLSETELIELPPFISNLKRLNYLNLQGCQKLQRLNNLHFLLDLHYLNLSCCPEVTSFPESLENLTKLRFLNLSGCSSLSTLPIRFLESFASLSSLVDLNLSGFEFQMLPDFFGNIYSLQYLNLSKCLKLEVLPQSFGQLSYLKSLNLSYCSDLKLLGSFACLTSLQFLNLSNCSRLEYLPSCFDKLSNLEYLNLSQCLGLKALPMSLPNLKNLQLDVSGCNNCMLQSISLSSRSSQSRQCSEKAEQVRSSSEISEITCEEPAEVEYLRNNPSKDLASISQLDENRSEEPEVVTEPSAKRCMVQQIPGNQLLSPSSHFSSFASSSVPFASSSSDTSTSEHPVSNEEATALTDSQSNEKCNTPIPVKDGLISEDNAPKPALGLGSLVQIPDKIQNSLKVHFGRILKKNGFGGGEADMLMMQAQETSSTAAATEVRLDKQLQAWKNNPSWSDEPPEIKVTVPQGSLCNLNLKFKAGLPPDAVYNIIIDPENKRVFKNIKEVISRKVVLDEGSTQIVEVEQAAIWRFLWWSGVLSVHVFVDQNRRNHTVKFKQGRTGFMKKFEGCWKIEPLFVDKEVCHPLDPCTLEEYNSCTNGTGRVGSSITLDQLIEPAMLPPPPISWYLRGITTRTTEMLVNDLIAETARLRGLANNSDDKQDVEGKCETNREHLTEECKDIKERWRRRRTGRHGNSLRLTSQG